MRHPKKIVLSKDYSVEQCAPNRTNRRFRIFKHLERVEKTWISGDPSVSLPISWEIHPTDKCNLSCGFCAYRDIRNAQMLDIQLFERIISELVEFQNTKSIVFSGGGEPTLHPYLPKAINELKKNNIDIGIITNGLFYKPELIESLSNCDWVRVSINAGNPKKYNLVTGGKEKTFETVLNNIEFLTSKKSDQIVGLSIVLSDQKIDEIEEVIELGVRLDVDYIMFRADIEYKLFDREYYVNNSSRVYDLEEKYSMITNYCVFLKDLFSDAQIKQYSKCPMVHDSLIGLISAKGNLLPCIPKYVNSHDESSISFGNLHNGTISDIWLSEKRMKKIAEIDISKCPKCRHHNMNEMIIKFVNNEFGIQECNDPHYNFL